jgi:UDP-3-O-[3-hydroxymyristoyl] glucosamine N-acyltransferase
MPSTEHDQAGWTLAELAPLLGATVGAMAEFVVHRPAQADSDDPNGLTFCDNERYRRIAENGSVGAAIVAVGSSLADKPFLRAADPRAAFLRFLALCARPLPLAAGIHPTAVVAADSEVDDSAEIGSYVVVESGAVIGAGARIFPFCYVGENCVVGRRTVLYPHVVLYQDVRLGENCVVHSHAVLGADGFRFVREGDGGCRKVPQAGRVVIGDEVEIGAGTTVDRATVGATTIASGSKLDNLVQIGHNVRLGADTLICAQSGVAGSAVVGDRVTMAGQTGVVDHVTIGDDATLAGRTVATRSLPGAGAYYGMPAAPLPAGLRAAALLGRLPELHQRIQALEKALAERS